MISTTQLAQLCRRAGTCLRAGLDVRQVWEREAKIGPLGGRARMTNIVERLDEGESVSDSMQAQEGYFPPLVTEMVHAGEQTGHLEQVFLQLADHYDNLIALRRTFLIGLTWPAIQLLMTLGVVGLLIAITGALEPVDLQGRPVDMLGLGLKGASGLIIYVSIVATFAVAVGTLIVALSRGWLWTGILMPVLMRIPVMGRCLMYLAMSRLSWCLSMALDAGMDAVSSIRMALKASQNVYYSSLTQRVEETMLSRCPMHDALRETGRFPEEFLLVLETGELSGMVSETLDRYANDCRNHAKLLLKSQMVIAGVGCALLVAVLIIFLIFRLASFYLGTLNDAINLTN